MRRYRRTKRTALTLVSLIGLAVLFTVLVNVGDLTLIGVAPEAWTLVLLMGSPVILVGGLLTVGVVALVERRVHRGRS